MNQRSKSFIRPPKENQEPKQKVGVNVLELKSCAHAHPTQVPKLAIVKPGVRSWLDTDYSRYYNDKMYTDVTLKFNARHVKSHKMILASASPIFADLFKNPNCIEVSISTNISYQSFNYMMEFIYTKKIKTLDVSVDIRAIFDLLTAGQTYNIAPLISFSEELISARLTEANVIDILTLSYDSKLETLLEKSIAFIISVGDPCALENWKDVYRYRGLTDLLFTRILPKKKRAPAKSNLPIPSVPPGVLVPNETITNQATEQKSRSRSAVKNGGSKKGITRTGSTLRR